MKLSFARFIVHQSLKLFLWIAFLSLTNASAFAQSNIPFFFDVLNELSDNAATYLINKPDSAADDVTLDVGDRLRGVFRVETIEDLSGGGSGQRNLLDPNQPTELTAIYDVTVVEKNDTGLTYQFVFGPTPISTGWDGILPVPAEGTMVRFYEDPVKNFNRLLPDGDTDDGDINLTGADIGSGPFVTEEEIASLSTGGSVFWDLGFTGAEGEGWEAQTSTDNILQARNEPPPGNSGNVNFGLNLTGPTFPTFLGPPLGDVASVFGGSVNLFGSTNILAIQNVQTPYDVFHNVDFVILPLGICIDIEKEVSVDGGTTWHDADDCANAPVATAGDAEYRLIVTNCGPVDLTDVTITDSILGINVNIGTLAAEGEPVIITKAYQGFVNLDQPDLCPLTPGEPGVDGNNFTNIATVIGTSALDPAQTATDEDPACVKCPADGEGCTPGYWRNHLEDWPPTGYAPGDDFDTTFSVDLFDPNITLEEAVNAKGGGDKKLARHGTAALLSAAHPDVNYPFTVAEVIALVQAGDADTLVEANELGCEIP